MKLLESFLYRLWRHAEQKEKLYDGIDVDMPIDVALRYTIEELGEIATEISRNRYSSAMDECFDLAHCSFLIFKAIYTKKLEDR